MGTLLPPQADQHRGDAGSVGPAARTGAAARHDPQRPAADRHPRGHRPAGRSHQVRPDGRQRSRWSFARRTTSSTRSPGAPLPPVDVKTTGVILKILVDSYGVLPPEVVQTVTPDRRSRRSFAGRTIGRRPHPGATGASDHHVGPAPVAVPPELDPSQRPEHQGPTRARWPTRSASSSSTTSPRPAIT